MLLFSTVLPINDRMTKDDFVKLVIEWNQKSPYKENVISNINWNGEYNNLYEDKNLSIEFVEYRNKNTIAVRYEKIEKDGVIWDTDFVMNFTDRKLSIRLDRSFTEDALSVESSFSSPRFISLLISNNYVLADNDLEITYEPSIIDKTNIDTIVNIIMGKSTYMLPVVYVSKTYHNQDPVNVRDLARKLKGIAHVIVQGSNEINPVLRERCDNKNEYFGAIGVYFPIAAFGHRKFFYRTCDEYDSVLFKKVIRTVTQYSNSQKVDPLYTWQGINNSILLDKLASQKEKRLNAEQEKNNALSEAETLIAQFDDDVDKLKNQIEALTKTNNSLLYENQGLREKINSCSNRPVLYFGDEEEFFSDEIKDILLGALKSALDTTNKNTRNYDVINDIITYNGGYKNIAGKKSSDIKKLLKGYRNVTATMKQALKNMGFEISDEGKHYKLSYYGDSRYCTTIAKTPSDNKTGMNTALTITSIMF